MGRYRERSPRGRGRDERSGRNDRDMRNPRAAREPAARASPAPPARAVVREDDGLADGVHSSKWRPRGKRGGRGGDLEAQAVRYGDRYGPAAADWMYGDAADSQQRK